VAREWCLAPPPDRGGGAGSVTGSDLNEPMIAAAAELAPTEAAITWRLADAEHLPFDDTSYDVVVCQQGLQFVPDCERAVSEMHRVLRPSGRVAASVWRGMDENPYFVAASIGLTEHVGPGADAFLTAACRLADPDEVGAIFEGAGFADVSVETAELLGQMMPAAELILGNLSGTPVAEALEEMTTVARQAMVDTIMAHLADDIDEQGQVRVLTRTNVVTATRV
jgi:SAM-dependent methyltransferase